MKRLLGLIPFVLLIAAWLIAESVLFRRVVPPAHVTDLNAFLAWRTDAARFSTLPNDATHLIATAPGGGLLPSGSSAYVFDSTGRLVDWCPDIGDRPAFDQKWNAQRSLASETPIPRAAVATWPTPTTRPAR